MSSRDTTAVALWAAATGCAATAGFLVAAAAGWAALAVMFLVAAFVVGRG